MKQKILLTLLIAFFIKSYSQEKKINFQLSLGPTLSIPKTSKLTNSNVEGNPEIKSSINVGVYILPSLNYSFNQKTSLDFGLGFFMNRFFIENKSAAITHKGNRNINQLQTPINVNFHFGNDNSYQLGIGGFASFLISAKEKGETRIDYSQIDIQNPSDNMIYENIDYAENIKDSYNSLSFGGFIQLKKNVSFSPVTKGFFLVKINQYFNSIKNKDYNWGFEFKNEKEPTTVNLGIGIIL